MTKGLAAAVLSLTVSSVVAPSAGCARGGLGESGWSVADASRGNPGDEGGAGGDAVDAGDRDDAGDDGSRSGDLFDSGSDAYAPVDDSACAQQRHALGACIGCCQRDHADGFDAYHRQAVQCLCGSGPCAIPCGNELCANRPLRAGDSCGMCLADNLGHGTRCGDQLQNACSAVAACVSYRTCTQARCDGRQ